MRFYCDNEPAILALRRVVTENAKGIELVPQGPPPGDNQKNGRIENAVRELKRQMRTTRAATEAKFQQTIPNDHPMLTHLPRFCALCISQERIRSDGMTADQLRIGGRCKRRPVQFMERIFFRKLGKLLDRQMDGRRRMDAWRNRKQRAGDDAPASTASRAGDNAPASMNASATERQGAARAGGAMDVGEAFASAGRAGGASGPAPVSGA